MRQKKVAPKYSTIAEYRKQTRAKVVALAKILRMSRFRVTALVYPDRYPVDLTDEETARVAALLNQPTEYVRKLYPRAA